MNIVDSLVEVKIAQEQDFLKVKESLTRIVIASRKEKRLFQSCHILHKQGRYYIVHFKELFILDGKPSDFSDEDKGRRNTITQLLAQWGLVKIVDENQVKTPTTPISQIKIIKHDEKGDWILEAKYNIGRRKK
ncbi:MAG: translational repressor RegA [Candidatus Bathyarchaeia archaeon]